MSKRIAKTFGLELVRFTLGVLLAAVIVKWLPQLLSSETEWVRMCGYFFAATLALEVVNKYWNRWVE